MCKILWICIKLMNYTGLTQIIFWNLQRDNYSCTASRASSHTIIHTTLIIMHHTSSIKDTCGAETPKPTHPRSIIPSWSHIPMLGAVFMHTHIAHAITTRCKTESGYYLGIVGTAQGRVMCWVMWWGNAWHWLMSRESHWVEYGVTMFFDFSFRKNSLLVCLTPIVAVRRASRGSRRDAVTEPMGRCLLKSRSRSLCYSLLFFLTKRFWIHSCIYSRMPLYFP